MKTDKLNLIKAIFFDFGDTLVTLSLSREELFIQSAQNLGLQLNIKEVKMAYRIVDFNNKYSSIKIDNKKDRHYFYTQYNRQICNALGIASFFPELQPILMENFEKKKKWNLLHDTVPVLEKLITLGIPLAVVANWDKGLAALADALGIKRFFRYIISSQEAGVEKPEPEIFNHALQFLSLLPRTDHILYIGNEYEADVICAKAAGLIPILIDRHRFYPYADCMRFESLSQWYDSLNLSEDGAELASSNSIK